MMRLKKINIIHFGQLSDLHFQLPSRELNVFFGQNEAGKSTTVAFIKQIMFGFYLRSTSSPFFEDYKPLAQVSPMGGSLVFIEDNHTFKLERLWAKGDKTKRGILTVYRDNQQVPEQLFFDRIKKIDGNFYTDSFIFNQEMLGQVASLSQKDLLERIYYLGAANSAQMLEIRDQFAKKAGQLFKKSGRKPVVNADLKKLTERRQDLTEKQSQFADYQNEAKEYHNQQAEIVKINQEIANLQQKLKDQNKLLEQVANYQKLQSLQQKLEPVKFTAANYQQAQELFAQQKNLQQNLQQTEKQLADIQLDQQFDSETAQHLVQKKAEVLQWQSQSQDEEERAQQVKLEQQQILQLHPDLKHLTALTREKIKQLSHDYQALPDKAQNTQLSSYNLFRVIGYAIDLIGLFILFSTSNSILAISLIVLGIASIAYGFYQKNQDKQAEEQVLNKQAVFRQKYGFVPNKDMPLLIEQYNNYLVKEQQLETINENLQQLIQKQSKLAEQLSSVLEQNVSADLKIILSKINQLEDRINKNNLIKQKQASLEGQVAQDKQNLRELRLQLNAILAKDDVQSMAEYQSRYQASLSQTKIKTQIAALQDNLQDNLANLKELDVAALKEEIKQEETTISKKQAELLRKQQIAAESQVKLNNLADSTAIFNAKQELANEETKFLNDSKEYLANLFADKWISRALDLASNERFPKMMMAAKDYFKLLTGGRYVDVVLTKKITVTRADGKKRDIKYLSRGTAEQLYFALKLAFVEQIKDEINLPILIDDSFVNFDERRVGYIKQLLEKIEKNNQVLIFTAQNSLVNELGIKPLTFKKEEKNA